jgi:hypothetical protein
MIDAVAAGRGLSQARSALSLAGDAFADPAPAHDPGDLTDRETVAAWGYGRPNHMINSGQFLFQPRSRPLKRSQIALAPPAV